MWSKAIVLDDDRFDCERVRDALVDQGMDAEAVMSESKLDSAVQWWHPDVIVMNPLTRTVNVEAFLERFFASEHRVPVVFAAPVSEKSLQAWAEDAGADGFHSTLSGVKGLMRKLRDTYDTVMFGDDSGVGW